MAVLTTQDGSAGLDSITFDAAAADDQVESGAIAGGWEIPVVLIAKNADTVSHTVTVNGITITLPATTGNGLVPVRGASRFGDILDVTYDAVTSVTVAAVRLGRL